MPGVNLAEAGQAGMRCQQSHKLLALVDVAYKDISAQMWQNELYRATIENCTTERGWANNQAQKIANEHRTQENRVPQYLADLQSGNPWLEETIIDNLNKFEPEENSGHDFTSTSKHGCGHGCGRGGRGRGTYQHKTDQAPQRKQAQAVPPCSVPPNQIQAPLTG